MRPPPRFTEEQKAALGAHIHEYLSRDEKKELAKELKLGLDQVSNYLNRRRKEEKEKKKMVDLENRIKELENELQQANDQISSLNETLGLWQQLQIAGL